MDTHNLQHSGDSCSSLSSSSSLNHSMSSASSGGGMSLSTASLFSHDQHQSQYIYRRWPREEKIQMMPTPGLTKSKRDENIAVSCIASSSGAQTLRNTGSRYPMLAEENYEFQEQYNPNSQSATAASTAENIAIHAQSSEHRPYQLSQQQESPSQPRETHEVQHISRSLETISVDPETPGSSWQKAYHFPSSGIPMNSSNHKMMHKRKVDEVFPTKAQDQGLIQGIQMYRNQVGEKNKHIYISQDLSLQQKEQALQTQIAEIDQQRQELFLQLSIIREQQQQLRNMHSSSTGSFLPAAASSTLSFYGYEANLSGNPIIPRQGVNQMHPTLTFNHNDNTSMNPACNTTNASVSTAGSSVSALSSGISIQDVPRVVTYRVYIDDGHIWGKNDPYVNPGQWKMYYNCLYPGCEAKRRIQWSTDNPEFLTCIYFGQHKHGRTN